MLGKLFGSDDPLAASTRSLAVMHLVDGMTLEEVARESRLSVSGVRKRLRGLQRTSRGAGRSVVMQQDNRNVPDWLLERLALGELDAETAADVRRRLAAEGRSPDDIAAARRGLEPRDPGRASRRAGRGGDPAARGAGRGGRAARAQAGVR